MFTGEPLGSTLRSMQPTRTIAACGPILRRLASCGGGSKVRYIFLKPMRHSLQPTRPSKRNGCCIVVPTAEFPSKHSYLNKVILYDFAFAKFAVAAVLSLNCTPLCGRLAICRG